MRFIRKHGRVIPIRDSGKGKGAKQFPATAKAAAAGVVAGISLYGAAHAAPKAWKFGEQVLSNSAVRDSASVFLKKKKIIRPLTLAASKVSRLKSVGAGLAAVSAGVGIGAHFLRGKKK